jgi:hypothetical protein
VLVNPSFYLDIWAFLLDSSFFYLDIWAFLLDSSFCGRCVGSYTGVLHSQCLTRCIHVVCWVTSSLGEDGHLTLFNLCGKSDTNAI